MVINVSVKAGSNENSIEKIGECKYVAKVDKPADKNKANIALLKLLSDYFNVSYKKIKIKNPTSRNKFVEIKL